MTFQIDSICRENTDEAILNALEDLPKDLPTTYRRILRRLRDSGSTDPLTGKKVFELIAAARRPLTLEELREAISIEPGNTTWSTAKLVNDVMKSLDCCGSLIVVDEELSTVHFAHSSVKQHLEARPENLDIPEYHVKVDSADLSMSKIIITYLNLDVFQGQLSKSRHTSASPDATLLLRAGLPQGTLASNLARVLLKNRKIPNYDVGRDLEKVAGFTKKLEVPPQRANSFLSYAREHWLSHIRFYGCYYDRRMRGLLARVICGDIQVLELPWTSEDARTVSSHFLDSISRRSALTFCVSERLREQGKEGVHGMKQLLRRYSYGGILSVPKNLLDVMVEGRMADLQLLFDANPPNYGTFVDGTLLHIALMCGNVEIVEMLLDYGAKPNATGYYDLTIIEIAALSSIGEQVIPLLLGRGTDEIPIHELYSDELKEVLHLHRRKQLQKY